MRRYSRDLRERIIRAVEEGEKQRKVAKRFGVSESSVKRYLQRKRKKGILEPNRIGGSKSIIEVAGLEAALLAQVKQHSDASLDEHVALLAKTSGVRIGRTSMWRTLKRLGLTRKKNESAP